MLINEGGYHLQYSGNLLTFHGRGPWSKDAVLRFQEDMKSAISYFAGKKWGFIGYLAGESLLPPEAEGYLKDISVLHVSQGMQACAIILADTNYPAVVRSQAERVYEYAGVNNSFFDTEKEALSWINNLGYSQK